MKRMLRVTGTFLLLLTGFVLAYLICAYVLARLSTNGTNPENGSIPVYILTNGVHTDIVVPVRTSTIDWSREIRFSNTHREDTLAGWLGFGWGDKGFYLETPTWADLKFSTAFRAVFGLSHTAMHTTFYDTLKVGESCRLMYLNNEHYEMLVTYIRTTLQYDADNKPVYISTNANYGNNDAFYEANGSYSLFHTCNTWANNGLKACGQKACLWTPFDKGIFYHYPLDTK